MENDLCQRCRGNKEVAERGYRRIKLCKHCCRRAQQRYWRAIKTYPEAKVTVEDYYSSTSIRLSPKKPKQLLKARASAARRCLMIALRTPKWVDVNAILAIYMSRPYGYHIDHIVPLCGSNVSGLHVPWNLQAIPALDNIKKHKKFSSS